MKILTKPIEVVSVTDFKGNITPVRFKYLDEQESNVVIKIDRVIFSEKERLAGNYMMLYRCRSLIDDVEKVYEIKYELASCKWILYKM